MSANSGLPTASLPTAAFKGSAPSLLWGQRRGATPAYTARDDESSSSRSNEHRLARSGEWQPKGVAARAVWASVSETGSAIDGSRKINQDACVASVPSELGSSALFAVFDGHGEHGHIVSQQAASELPRLLESELRRTPDVRSALVAAHLEQDRQCTQAIDCTSSGSTAVTCRLAVDPQTSQIVCHAAWLGDSRAVVGSVRTNGTLGAVELTRPHTPELPAELARIEASGGSVEATLIAGVGLVGPPRVWKDHQVAPGLAMSRSLGDVLGAEVGVCAEADVAERVLGSEDALLVLASDGLWEFLPPQQVVATVAERLRGVAITEEAVLATASLLCEQARPSLARTFHDLP